jgi:hypothetical protein
MRTLNAPVQVGAVDFDLSASRNGNPINLDYIDLCAIQAVITGSPVGSMKLQGSCDVGTSTTDGNPANNVVTNWTDVAGSSQAVSAAGNLMFNISDAGWKWLRVVYTFTSGTGTAVVRINGKSKN